MVTRKVVCAGVTPCRASRAAVGRRARAVASTLVTIPGTPGEIAAVPFLCCDALMVAVLGCGGFAAMSLYGWCLCWVAEGPEADGRRDRSCTQVLTDLACVIADKAEETPAAKPYSRTAVIPEP